MKRTFISTFIWVLILWLLAGQASAQLTFGLVPEKNSLIRSEEDARILTTYLEDRLDEKIYIELIKDESSLLRKIKNGKIDLAVVSSLFYRKYWKEMQVLANYTRTEAKTHKLLLLSSKSGSIKSIEDLRKGKHTLVLDEKSGSRFSFLTKTLKADPKDVFRSIQTSAQMVDTLSGLTNGSYDVACIEDGLLETVRRFDPGLVDRLRVVESSGPLASDPIVTKKSFNTSVRKRIEEIFLKMESDSDGQQILLSLKISKFVPSITEVSYYIKEVDPAQYRKSRRQEKVETAKVAPVVKVETPVKIETPVEPEVPKELPADTQKAVEEKAEVSKQDDAAVGQGQPQSVNAVPIVTQEAEKKTPIQSDPGARQSFDLHEKIKDLQGDTSRMKILKMVVPAVLGFIVLLLILPWFFGKKKKKERTADEKGMAVRNVHEKEEMIAAASDKKMGGEQAAPARRVDKTQSTGQSPFMKQEDEVPDQSLVELRGELKTIKIPELLQLMASCNNTGALTIQSQHDEKCLYFRDGKICSASCLDKDNKNKIGNILVKIGKVTESERERALALCSENPSLRLGNALLQIGAVDKSDLQEALRVQAEEIVYSLFLFPEGRFEFQEIEPRVNPDENLALDVMHLLMEGARREDEWKNMREAIPSMEVVPKYIDKGQEKLDGAGLTNDQKLILSLIDGQRSIRDICIRSPLVDFEVCDLIYRLIRLSVLKCEINAENGEKNLKFGS